MSGSTDLVNALTGGSVLGSIAHPAVVNPLAAYSGAQQAAALGWENRIYQARQAAGQAYQQATDPATGQVDPGRAQALIAANPQAALVAQPTATSGQALQQQNALFNQQQQAAIGREIGSVLTLPDSQQTQANYKQALDLSLAHHGITQDHYNAALQSLTAAGNDPAALRQYGTRLLVGTMAGPEMASTVMPANTGINLGGTYQPLVQRPAVLGGGLTPAPGAMSTTLSPGEKVQTQPVLGPGNQPGTVPVGAKYDRYGNPLDANGKPTGNPLLGGLTVGDPAAPGQPTAAPQAAPGGQPAAAPQAGPRGFTPTGMTPQAEVDTKAFLGDRLALPAKQTSLQNLQHAYDALKLTSSGKSSETTHALFAYLQTNGLLPAGATDELKNYELFRKYTERNVADLGNASGTDAGRSLAAQSNAGTSLSTPANLEVLANDIAKQRQAIATTMSLPDQQAGSGYGAHSAKIAASTDPRGFRWDMYSDPEKAAILKSVGKEGSPTYNALVRAIGLAHTFNAPGGGR